MAATKGPREDVSVVGRTVSLQNKRRHQQLAQRDAAAIGDIAANIYLSEQQKAQRKLEELANKGMGVGSAREQKRQIALRLRRKIFGLKVYAFLVFIFSLLIFLGSALLVNLDRWSRIEGTPVAHNQASSWEETNPFSGYCYCETVSSSVADLLTSAASTSSSSGSSTSASSGSSSSTSVGGGGSSGNAPYCGEASNSFEGLAALSIILIGLEVAILTLHLWEAAYFGRFGGSHAYSKITFALLLLAFITSVLCFTTATIIMRYELCGMVSFADMGIVFGIAPWMRLVESVLLFIMAVTAPLVFRYKHRGPQGGLIATLTFVCALTIISTCSRSWFVFDQQAYITKTAAATQVSSTGIAEGAGVSYIGHYAYLSEAARTALGLVDVSSIADAASATGTTTTTAPTNMSSSFGGSSSASAISAASLLSSSTVLTNLLKGISGTVGLSGTPPPAALRYFGVRDSCQCTHPCAPSIATNRFGIVKSIFGLFYRGTGSTGDEDGRDDSTNTLSFKQRQMTVQFTGSAAAYQVAGATDFSISAGTNASALLGAGDKDALADALVVNKERLNALTDSYGLGFRKDDDDLGTYLTWAIGARTQEYIYRRVASYLTIGPSLVASTASTLAEATATDAALLADPEKAIHILTAISSSAIQTLFPTSTTPYGHAYGTQSYSTSYATAAMLPTYPQYPLLWALTMLECLLAGLLFLFVILRIVDNQGKSVKASEIIAGVLLLITGANLGLTLSYGPASPGSRFECTSPPNASIPLATSSRSSTSSSSASSSASTSSSFSLDNSTLFELSSLITAAVPQVGTIATSAAGNASTFAFPVQEADYKSTKVFVAYYSIYLQACLIGALIIFLSLNAVYLPTVPLQYHDVTYARSRFHEWWWDILQDARTLAHEDREMAQLGRDSSSSSSDEGEQEVNEERERLRAVAAEERRERKERRRRLREEAHADAEGEDEETNAPSSTGSRRATESSSNTSLPEGAVDELGSLTDYKELMYKDQFFKSVRSGDNVPPTGAVPNAGHEEGLRRRRVQDPSSPHSSTGPKGSSAFSKTE